MDKGSVFFYWIRMTQKDCIRPDPGPQHWFYGHFRKSRFFYINLQHRETITFRENLKQHNYVFRGAIFSYGNLLQTQFRPYDFLSVIFRVIGCLHLVRKCYKKILMAQHQLTYLSRIRIRSYLVCFDPDPDPKFHNQIRGSGSKKELTWSATLVFNEFFIDTFREWGRQLYCQKGNFLI